MGALASRTFTGSVIHIQICDRGGRVADVVTHDRDRSRVQSRGLLARNGLLLQTVKWFSWACSMSHALGIGVFFAIVFLIAGIGRVLMLYAMERRAVEALQMG